jgi:hypothetical protein
MRSVRQDEKSIYREYIDKESLKGGRSLSKEIKITFGKNEWRLYTENYKHHMPRGRCDATPRRSTLR